MIVRYKHSLNGLKKGLEKIANNHMHSDSKKRRSSYLVALLFAAGDVRRYAQNVVAS